MAATRRRPEVPPRREEFSRKCIYPGVPWLTSVQDLPGNVVRRALEAAAKGVLLSDRPELLPRGTGRDAGKQSSYLKEGRGSVRC